MPRLNTLSTTQYTTAIYSLAATQGLLSLQRIVLSQDFKMMSFMCNTLTTMSCNAFVLSIWKLTTGIDDPTRYLMTNPITYKRLLILTALYTYSTWHRVKSTQALSDIPADNQTDVESYRKTSTIFQLGIFLFIKNSLKVQKITLQLPPNPPIELSRIKRKLEKTHLLLKLCFLLAIGIESKINTKSQHISPTIS